jgi:hypothetical protein
VFVTAHDRRLRGLPGRGARSFVLASRFYAAVVDFRLVFVRVAFGSLAASGLCRVWLFLFSVSVGLSSCVAVAASAVLLGRLCSLRVPLGFLLPFPFASLCNTMTHPVRSKVPFSITLCYKRKGKKMGKNPNSKLTTKL